MGEGRDESLIKFSEDGDHFQTPVNTFHIVIITGRLLHLLKALIK